MLQRALVAHAPARGMELLLSYANDAAAPIYRRVGFREVCRTRTWVKRLRTRDKLEERGPWVARLAPLVDGALRWVDEWGFGLVPRIAHSVSSSAGLELRSGVSDRSLETLSVGADWPRGIQGDRDVAHIRWRYRTHPTEHHDVFGVERGGAMIGYVAVHRADGVVTVRDAFWRGDASVLREVLLAVAGWARSVDQRSVCVVCTEALSDWASLGRIAFVERSREPLRPLFVRALRTEPAELCEAVLDAANWRLFDGELDV
jgi:hypothetical protein